MKTLVLILLLTITAAAQVKVAAPCVKATDTFEVAVYAKQTNGIAAYQFWIEYDPNVLELTGDESNYWNCTTKDTIAASMNVVCNGYTPGRLRAVFYGSQALADNAGIIFRVPFHPIGQGSSMLHFTNGHFFYWSGETPSIYYDGLALIPY